MQTTLTKTTTKTLKDVISFISTSAKQIFVHEFYENGFDFRVFENYILVSCADGYCTFDIQNYFVDSSSLVVTSK